METVTIVVFPFLEGYMIIKNLLCVLNCSPLACMGVDNLHLLIPFISVLFVSTQTLGNSEPLSSFQIPVNVVVFSTLVSVVIISIQCKLIYAQGLKE